MTELIEKYDNPVIRTLIQLIPYGVGSGIDVAIITQITKIRKKRDEIFFDKLSEGKVLLTQEMILNNDFLHSFFSTYKYAQNSRRNEKIEWFATILKTGIIEKKIKDYDKFDEYLNILDNLSVRDMYVLKQIELFESKYANSELKPKNKDFAEPFDILPHWHTELMEPIKEQLAIDEKEFKGILIRLISFSLFERSLEINDNRNTRCDTPDITGRLTINYHKLSKLIN